MEKFDIVTDSQTLKELVSVYDSNFFISEIAHLITTIQVPRIPFHPFVGLDSPLIQLLYIASLNISNESQVGIRKEIQYTDWVKIVEYSIRVKAGYYDALLPSDDEDEKAFYDKYRVSMPVFIEFYNTGTLNFEEQEIERIQKIYSVFNTDIQVKYGLDIDDFINIYNLIDEQINTNRNAPLRLISEDEETKSFWNHLCEEDLHPRDWKYDGSNNNIKELISLFQNSSNQFIFKKSDITKQYDKSKIDTFLSLFSIRRESRDYLYYTAPNLLISQPIFDCGDGKYIVTDIKQIIHAIQKLLESFCIEASGERFYKRRGKYLQDKTKTILETYFGHGAYIFNEYKTSPDGEGQDLLLLYKGFALIIETKAGKEPEPRRNPNVKESFKVISRYFKQNIQSGYEQANRIKNLFVNRHDFTIFQGNESTGIKVRTSKFHSVFSLIITLNKFREVQINLNHLLELSEGESHYPISMCIDDLEVLLLTFKRLSISLHDFIKFLNFRQQLQGRLESNDELEIWADFIQKRDFKIPDNPEFRYRPGIYGADLFDDLYEKGLGFQNEKFLSEKRTRKILSFRNYLKKHYGYQRIE